MYDVIIIGAGVTGLGAAWHLTETLNKNVLLVEQFPFPNQFGSSAGHSRITRELYPEDFNCVLMKEAHKMWHLLEEKSGKKLFYKNGLIKFDSDEHLKPYFEAIEKSGISACELTHEEAKRKFPNFSIPPNFRIIFDSNAGVLRADRCLQVLMDRSISHGLVFKEMEKVLDILEEPKGHMSVRTNKSSYNSKSVILCNGIWSSKCLEKLGITLPLSPVKIHYAYFRKKNSSSEQFSYENIPSFICPSRYIYGMCGNEYPDCLKIGDFSSDAIDPDKRDYDQGNCESKMKFLNNSRDYLASYIPETDLEPINVATCVITRTPDSLPIIDRHPTMKNLIIGCGFNGYGFKTGVIHGKYLAELSVGISETNSICPQFGIGRFLSS